MSKEDLVIELHRENLSTYFILPLIKLNKERFVSESNFIDSYLSKSGKSIFVKVVDVQFFEHRMVMHPQYQGRWVDHNDFNYIEYSIPFKWAKDVDLFIQGKYSHMSPLAKDMICNNSGLQYRERRKSDNVPITDVRLLALERSIAVREMWEEHYGMTLSDDQELLSIPQERSFIESIPLTKFEAIQ